MGAGKDIDEGALGDDATDLSTPWDKSMPEAVQLKSLTSILPR